MTMLKISKFVARYELEPHYFSDGEQKLHYIIDIYRNEDGFFPKVLRRDYFRIYPVGIEELCEEELLVFDVFEEWEELKGNSEDEVMKNVVLKIEEKLAY